MLSVLAEPHGWLLVVLPVLYVLLRAPIVTAEMLRSLVATRGREAAARELIARFERGRRLDQCGVLVTWLATVALPALLAWPLFAFSCYWFTERARARFDWLQQQ
jgi:hypothetical protein